MQKTKILISAVSEMVKADINGLTDFFRRISDFSLTEVTTFRCCSTGTSEKARPVQTISQAAPLLSF